MSSPERLTVGFDLDMTLIDSRPGIGATYRAVAAHTGVYIDVDAVVSRLGPPLVHEMTNWFPPDRIDEAVDLYRSFYPGHAIEPTLPLPGAAEALAAVHAAGGRVIVVTAKRAELARLHLEHLALAADVLVGDAWADGKAAALREYGASVYVGDHTADMAAARSADTVGVGVLTGPCDDDALRAAGAATVLPDLRGFPAWWSAVGISVGRLGATG
ncbi:HAD family hydrolase [Planosporangium flavigriseum]|uniref:Hydrolase n=1 Tax=Planosporangium flavigriseum TaxID=373681 RepID=A0A8J3LN55_9ACTN|nr:haloacid dehalogenase-like hydrolase [Planosporangium flavigriseum]NJC66842.1 HAD family hydrolase [Planosporangium flavigriseum]GIG74414.1 hydrolase [Planosporangium flavigriseum]